MASALPSKSINSFSKAQILVGRPLELPTTAKPWECWIRAEAETTRGITVFIMKRKRTWWSQQLPMKQSTTNRQAAVEVLRFCVVWNNRKVFVTRTFPLPCSISRQLTMESIFWCGGRDEVAVVASGPKELSPILSVCTRLSPITTLPKPDEEW